MSVRRTFGLINILVIDEEIASTGWKHQRNKKQNLTWQENRQARSMGWTTCWLWRRRRTKEVGGWWVFETNQYQNIFCGWVSQLFETNQYLLWLSESTFVRPISEYLLRWGLLKGGGDEVGRIWSVFLQYYCQYDIDLRLTEHPFDSPISKNIARLLSLKLDLSLQKRPCLGPVKITKSQSCMSAP